MPVGPVRLIERFYHEVWNLPDEAVAREILGPNLRFRGSLGPERYGVEGFIDYLRAVRAALPDFMCEIVEIVSSNVDAAARMRFVGTHRGDFFGIAATGRRIEWAGAAFFKTDGDRITELWVLGDVDSVKQQLGAARETGFSIAP